MERHTYLCRTCNQTKTYILPRSNSEGPHSGSDRAKPREIPW